MECVGWVVHVDVLGELESCCGWVLVSIADVVSLVCKSCGVHEQCLVCSHFGVSKPIGSSQPVFSV